MAKHTTLLSQIQALLPFSIFQQVVRRTGADHKVQKTTCWSYLQVLLIGLMTSRCSLRDLVSSLEDRLSQLRHLRIRSVNRSTLSYASRHRPADVLPQVYHAILRRYRALIPASSSSLMNHLVRLDSTVISVSPLLTSWATWSEGRAGVRLHLGLAGADLIPTIVRVTPYKTGELTIAKQQTYSPGTILCVDRGYFDPSLFTMLHHQGCTFVTLWRTGTNVEVVRKLAVAQRGPVIADEIIRFTGRFSGAHCSLEIRRITYVDPGTGKRLIFLTNQLEWAPQIIADLYRARWQIETFFRWLKSYLKLRRFWCITENGMLWQIWTALILYLLLKLLLLFCKKGWSLLILMRKLAAMIFESVPIEQIIELKEKPPFLNSCFCSKYS